MSNTFGQHLKITLFGESHGPYVGVTMDGLAPGIGVEEAYIAQQLSRRRPSFPGESDRRETDDFRIVSGLYRGHTNGSPLTILIPNNDTVSADYMPGIARPSHADYTAHVKYRGFADPRGGGHFSGRLTAPLVAAGAVVQPVLEARDIRIGTHILTLGGFVERSFDDLPQDIAHLQKAAFPVLTKVGYDDMVECVTEARRKGDSVGGITETAVIGLPAGLGEPYFDSMESCLSHLLFSVGGIKGVQFGLGFGFGSQWGSRVNDCFAVKEGAIVTESNYNGGINGGITNGMPLLFSCAVKPTPTILQPLKTVNFNTMEELTYCGKGRHDAAIVRRICPVIDACTALVLYDLLAAGGLL